MRNFVRNCLGKPPLLLNSITSGMQSIFEKMIKSDIVKEE